MNSRIIATAVAIVVSGLTSVGGPVGQAGNPATQALVGIRGSVAPTPVEIDRDSLGDQASDVRSDPSGTGTSRSAGH